MKYLLFYVSMVSSFLSYSMYKSQYKSHAQELAEIYYAYEYFRLTQNSSVMNLDDLAVIQKRTMELQSMPITEQLKKECIAMINQVMIDNNLLLLLPAWGCEDNEYNPNEIKVRKKISRIR